MHHPKQLEGVAPGTVLNKPDRHSGEHRGLELTNKTSVMSLEGTQNLSIAKQTFNFCRRSLYDAV